ncbi:MAG: J domain-containing protein [Caldiserica bacterium]|nr:MAG: J domain-containing protein [Caldisericota bacterium]
MKRFNFSEIEWAREVLGLPEEATFKEIKDAYRELVKKYHPDKCRKKDKEFCEEKMKEINKAYEIITLYCANYKYSFKKKDVESVDIEQVYRDHLDRFYDGWWGDLGEEEH